MNYRHAFHAGNFADLVKHATLTRLLAALQAEHARVAVVDTHAGAGAYDLQAPLSAKTREAEAGIVRLMADDAAPTVFGPLKSEVRRLNPDGGVRYYPGSPLLAAQALRPQDSYLGCELRVDDAALLRETLNHYPNASAVQADGYVEARNPPPPGTVKFVLIDPPFERSDDYDNIVDTIAAVRAAEAEAIVAAWLPLKDLETFDSFLRRLEDEEPGSILIVEARLKPLREPLKMNGCVMILINAPSGLQADLQLVCDWVAKTLGAEGALGRVTALD